MFSIGQHVIVNPEVSTRYSGQVFVVRELPKGVRGVNYKLDLLGGGRGLVASADVLLAHDAAPLPAPVAPSYEYVPVPALGTVVRIAGPGWREPADRLWVVVGETGKGARVAALGGDRNRYYTGVAARRLTEVPLSELFPSPDKGE